MTYSSAAAMKKLSFLFLLITCPPSVSAIDSHASAIYDDRGVLFVSATLNAPNGCYHAIDAFVGSPPGEIAPDNALPVTFRYGKIGGEFCSKAIRPLRFHLAKDTESTRAIVYWLEGDRLVSQELISAESGRKGVLDIK